MGGFGGKENHSGSMPETNSKKTSRVRSSEELPGGDEMDAVGTDRGEGFIRLY